MKGAGAPWHLALILAVSVGVYLNAFPNAFVWDDRYLVIDNPALMFSRQSFKVGARHHFWGGLNIEAVGGAVFGKLAGEGAAAFARR